MDMKTNDTYGLFMEALDVVNTAISEHKDGQLMGGLLTAALSARVRLSRVCASGLCPSV